MPILLRIQIIPQAASICRDSAAAAASFALTLQSAHDLHLARERAGPAIARLPTR